MLHITVYDPGKRFKRGQELSNDVSFLIFGHQTWDLEGGFSSTPAGIGLSVKRENSDSH